MKQCKIGKRPPFFFILTPQASYLNKVFEFSAHLTYLKEFFQKKQLFNFALIPSFSFQPTSTQMIKSIFLLPSELRIYSLQSTCFCEDCAIEKLAV